MARRTLAGILRSAATAKYAEIVMPTLYVGEVVSNISECEGTTRVMS